MIPSASFKKMNAQESIQNGNDKYYSQDCRCHILQAKTNIFGGHGFEKRFPAVR